MKWLVHILNELSYNNYNASYKITRRCNVREYVQNGVPYTSTHARD